MDLVNSIKYDSEFAKKIDLTYLLSTSTTKDIENFCKEAEKLGVGTVYVPQIFVPAAEFYLKHKPVLIGTVIGYPYGNVPTVVKTTEAKEAILNYTDELEMVITINAVKDKNFRKIKDEIERIHDFRLYGKKPILKVIVESPLLTEEEIKTVCDICMSAGVDYITTSAFSIPFETCLKNVQTISSIVGDNCKIKANCKINTFNQAEVLFNAGANKIGLPFPIIVPETTV